MGWSDPYVPGGPLWTGAASGCSSSKSDDLARLTVAATRSAERPRPTAAAGVVPGSRVSLATSRWVLLLPALLVAGSATMAVALTGFDGLYGQDSFAYFSYATGALRESLLHLHPWPAFFWPPGYPLLVAVVSFVTGSVPLAGQIVSISAGAAAACFTGLLASELVVRDRAEGPRPGPTWLPVP